MNRDTFLALLARKFSDELSAEELLLFQEAINSKTEYKLLEREMTAYFQQKEKSAVNTNGKLRHIWEVIEEQPVQQPYYRMTPLLKIAAAFFIVLGIGFILYNFYDRPSAMNDFTEIKAGNEKVYATMKDGTQIILNKHSSVQYNIDFGESDRKIILTGEAFFDVTANKKVPLMITAENLHIEVKGTAFNVKAYQQAEQIEVSLLRGSIEISSDLDKDQKILLQPNQKLFANVDNSNSAASQLFKILPLSKASILPETNWTRDSLAFKKEKLKDLALHLEKKYQVKIEIRNEELKNKKFSGIFTDEALNEALEALKLSYPFTYRITGKAVVIE